MKHLFTLGWSVLFLFFNQSLGAQHTESNPSEIPIDPPTHLHPKTLEKLNKNRTKSGLRIIRYEIAAEPYSQSLTLWQRFLKKAHDRWIYDSAEVYTLPESLGDTPYSVPGRSVVWHRNNNHEKTILGQFNPGLVNYNFQQVLDNKLFEAMLWQKYVPGAFPKTQSLSELLNHAGIDASRLTQVPTPSEIQNLKAALDQAYPEGWVIKGAYDYNTGRRGLVMNHDNLFELLESPEADYLRFQSKTEKENPDLDWEHILDILKDHPGFRGHLFREHLNTPQLSIVQSRMDIEKEYRVPVIEGQILDRGAIVDRYYYELTRTQQWVQKFKQVLNGDPHVVKIISAVEGWLAQLPRHYRMLPYGLDVAVLKDGSIRLIETNVGGNDGFLYERRASSRALNRYLRSYAKRADQNLVYRGLDRETQIKILRAELSNLGLTPDVHFPMMRFTESEVIDLTLQEKPLPCSALVTQKLP